VASGRSKEENDPVWRAVEGACLNRHLARSCARPRWWASSEGSLGEHLPDEQMNLSLARSLHAPSVCADAPTGKKVTAATEKHEMAVAAVIRVNKVFVMSFLLDVGSTEITQSHLCID
jgi:hypothetical protein